MAGESKNIAQMFEAIMAATHSNSLQLARLEERLESHMEGTNRRFEELQSRDRQICSFRHNDVDDKIARIEKIGEDLRADLVHRLEKDVAARSEALKETRQRGFEWKKYSVSVLVGILMLLLSTVISYHVSKMGKAASAAQPPTTVSSTVK